MKTLLTILALLLLAGTVRAEDSGVTNPGFFIVKNREDLVNYIAKIASIIDKIEKPTKIALLRKRVAVVLYSLAGAIRLGDEATLAELAARYSALTIEKYQSLKNKDSF